MRSSCWNVSLRSSTIVYRRYCGDIDRAETLGEDAGMGSGNPGLPEQQAVPSGAVQAERHQSQAHIIPGRGAARCGQLDTTGTAIQSCIFRSTGARAWAAQCGQEQKARPADRQTCAEKLMGRTARQNTVPDGPVSPRAVSALREKRDRRKALYGEGDGFLGDCAVIIRNVIPAKRRELMDAGGNLFHGKGVLPRNHIFSMGEDAGFRPLRMPDLLC